ncbi:MAG: hypothetical protein KC731_12360 [Myxococcales bacterium]|nr:hypothetical protein [Myxococcales bacterium]
MTSATSALLLGPGGTPAPDGRGSDAPFELRLAPFFAAPRAEALAEGDDFAAAFLAAAFAFAADGLLAPVFLAVAFVAFPADALLAAALLAVAFPAVDGVALLALALDDRVLVVLAAVFFVEPLVALVAIFTLPSSF